MYTVPTIADRRFNDDGTVTLFLTYRSDSGAPDITLPVTAASDAELAAAVSQRLTILNRNRDFFLSVKVGTAVVLTPDTPPDPPTQDQLDRQAFIEAVRANRATEKAFDLGLVKQDAVDAAAAAMKDAFKPGYETILAGIL